MKRNLLTKLISAVCAAALTTSCTAMSVGAVPIQISQTDWEQGYSRAYELVGRAHEVADHDNPLHECDALASDLEEFFNGVICNVVISETNYEKQADFLNKFACILNNIGEINLEQRFLGVGCAINCLYDIADLIEQHM